MYCIFCIETLEWGLCSAPEPSSGDFAVLRPTLFRGCYVGYKISELHLDMEHTVFHATNTSCFELEPQTSPSQYLWIMSLIKFVL
jgi:hypothetical protein